ncbi:unnamed protein product [Pylaiella littoralis]
MAEGSTRQQVWYRKGIKYPKGGKSNCHWVAEADFAKSCRPSRERVGGDSSVDDARVSMDAHQGAAPSREKRPRDCQQKSQDPQPPPENRGGAREGSGRPKGSYGPKRMQTLLHKCEAFL